MFREQRVSVALSILLGLLSASLAHAPSSVADSTANLQSQVDAVRGGCSPLQADPVLGQVAQRANTETAANIAHTARFTPVEDVMSILRDMGYPADKGKLIAGYGDSEAKATRGVTVIGWEAIPDCAYARYGVDVLTSSDGGYVLAALVLAGG
jgi:hypothetical protein